MAALSIAWSNILLVTRTRTALFFTFIFPLIFLFGYAGIFAGGNPTTVAYFFGPVVVLQVMGSAFWGLGLQSVTQRERGSLRRFRLAPIGPADMVMSSLLSNYLLLLPTVALLLFCAMVFFHMPLTISIIDLLILVTIGSFTFAGFGLTIGSVANTMQEAQVYNNVVWFPLLFLSGATIPLPVLPHWLQQVAAFLPATYLVDAFQGVMSTSEPLRAYWPELLALIISGMFGLMFAWKLFRWEKEERIPRSNKFLAATFIVPFLIIGAWMNARGNISSSFQKSYDLMTKSAAPSKSAASPSPSMTSLSQPCAIEHVRIFDGERIIAADTVLVKDGKISAVGKNLSVPKGFHIIDGTGDTLLPGLLDAHVHVFNKGALRQEMAFGVTTVLDMFTDYHFADQIKKEEADGKDLHLADMRSAGTLVTAPHGHGTEYGLKIPTITSPDQAQAFVDARIAEGSDYIKIIYDDGSTYGMHIPTISKATMAAVVRAAHQRGKIAVAHIGSYQGARDAIDAGVDGLAHLFVDRAPDPGFGKFVAAHHAYVTPTLTVLASICGTKDGATLAADPRISDYLPDSALSSLKAVFPRRPGEHTDFDAADQAIQQLKAAGVPLLAGTDSGNPGTTYGASLHEELALLVKAGLTPSEALSAATAVPARIYHLNDRGRIAPGLLADLLLVKGDPSEDVASTRNIVAIWKDGIPFDRASYRADIEKQKTAAAGHASPTGSASGLVSDFDDGKASARFGVGWQISTDSIMGGKSSAQMKVVSGGAQGSAGSLLVTGEIAPGAPYPWAGAMFMPGSTPFGPANLSSKKEISFWAKGDGKTYRIMLFTANGSPIPGIQNFVAGSDWKLYTFPLVSFVGSDPHRLAGVLFSGGPAPGKFQFQIDDVRFN
ncbi:MAG: CIA30 family protein [Terriglobia bacterium]